MGRPTAQHRHQLILVKRVNQLVNRWAFQCQYHDWTMPMLLAKACPELGITMAEYYTWRRVYAE